jgi:hypothetical protein
MCNISNDSNNDGILKKSYFYFMNEGWNEEWNNEVEQKQVDNENGRRNFHIPSKGSCFWQGVECEFMDDVGLFVGCVIACDPREAIFDN